MAFGLTPDQEKVLVCRIIATFITVASVAIVGLSWASLPGRFAVVADATGVPVAVQVVVWGLLFGAAILRSIRTFLPNPPTESGFTSLLMAISPTSSFGRFSSGEYSFFDAAIL
ncbi:MAG: hypothetical protein ACOYON_12455 [Fimbriimonas sp.]